jgi:hypothetical protein
MTNHSEIEKLKQQRDDLLKQLDTSDSRNIGPILAKYMSLREALINAYVIAGMIPENFETTNNFTIHGIRYWLDMEADTTGLWRISEDGTKTLVAVFSHGGDPVLVWEETVKDAAVRPK